MRREYEMTQDDMNTLLDACEPVPYMVFDGHEPRSPQENANAAWALLGEKMGFDSMTVAPVSGKSDLFFTAEPVEVKPEEGLEAENARLKAEVETLNKAMRTAACGFCGHEIERGEGNEWKDLVAEHVLSCPKHPLAVALAEVERIEALYPQLQKWLDAFGSSDSCTAINKTAREVIDTKAENARFRESLQYIVSQDKCTCLSMQEQYEDGVGRCPYCEAEATLKAAQDAKEKA